MHTLTSKERLTRIFNGQSVDRIPMWMLFPLKPWQFSANVFESPSYQEVNQAVYAHTDLIGRLAFPRKPFLNAHPKAQDAGRVLCQSIDDLERILDMPFVQDLPWAPTYDEEVAALGDRGIPCIMLPDPLEFAHHAFPESEFPLVCFEEKPRMIACLDELQRRTLAYYKAFLESGRGDVYWINGMEYIVPPTLGPSWFADYATGYDKQLVDLVRSYGKKSMIHCHGRIGTLLNEFKTIGMDALHPLEAPPMGDVTLKAARDVLGPDCIFVGNIQYGDLFYGFSEDQIEAMTLSVIEESKRGPIILAITASPIMEVLPEHAARNYLRIIETCMTHGVY